MLRLVDDRVAEGLETFEAFGFARSVDAAVPVRYKVNSAVLRIADDDPAAVKLTVDENYVLEGRRGDMTPSPAEEAVPITVTASLTGDVAGGTVVRDRDTLVRVAVGDGADRAVSGADYVVSDGLRNGVLPIVIPAGENSASAAFRMRVIDDNVAGETDWSAVSRPGGLTTVDVSRTESVSITGAVAKGRGTDFSIAVTGTEVEIWDLNDRSPTAVDLAVSPVRVTEGDARHTARLTITASLRAPPIAQPSLVCLQRSSQGACLRSYAPVVPKQPPSMVLAEDLTVPISLSADTDSEGNPSLGWATSGTDYGTPVQVSPRPATGQSGVTVVIPAGKLSGSTVVDLPIIGDILTESNVLFGPSGKELLRVGANLEGRTAEGDDSETNQELILHPHLEGWTVEGAIFEITDDDPASLQLELDKTRLEENAGSQSVRVTARVVAPDGSAGAFPEDIPLVLQWANFHQNEGDESRLSATGLAKEDHDFRLQGTAQLEDDEPVTISGPNLRATVNRSQVTEGSEVDVLLNLRFQSILGDGGANVTVSVGVAGDSAVAGTDYELVSAHFQSPLTITNGRFSVHARKGTIGANITLRFRVTDDAMHEGAEVITIGTDRGASTQLVIPANDIPPPADRKLVTIPAGSSSASAVFDLEVVDDILDEGAGEDIVFRAVGAALLGSDLSARLRIVDNDSAAETIILTATPGAGRVRGRGW